jgi:hypothetical protein
MLGPQPNQSSPTQILASQARSSYERPGSLGPQRSACKVSQALFVKPATRLQPPDRIGGAVRPPRAPHQPTSAFQEAQRSNRDRWRPLRFNWQVNSCVCHSGGRRHQSYIAAPGVDARCCLLLRSCLHLANHVDWGRVLALTCLLSSDRRETGHSCVLLPRCPLPLLLASRTKRASNHHASGRLTPEASHRLFHLTQLLCTADRNPHRWCFDACRFNLSNISLGHSLSGRQLWSAFVQIAAAGAAAELSPLWTHSSTRASKGCSSR